MDPEPKPHKQCPCLQLLAERSYRRHVVFIESQRKLAKLEAARHTAALRVDGVDATLEPPPAPKPSTSAAGLAPGAAAAALFAGGGACGGAEAGSAAAAAVSEINPDSCVEGVALALISHLAGGADGMMDGEPSTVVSLANKLLKRLLAVRLCVCVSVLVWRCGWMGKCGAAGKCTAGGVPVHGCGCGRSTGDIGNKIRRPVWGRVGGWG